VAADLASVGARDPLAVLSMFVADGAALRQWSAGALLQTDNRAPLEFSGPRSIFGLTRDDNPAAIRDLAVLQPPPAAVERALSTADGAAWRRAGQMAQQADAYRTASAHFTRAIERDPEDREALDGLVRASAPLGKTADTRAFLTRLASAPGRMAAKLALSSLLAAEGAFDESVRIPLGVLQSDPVNLPALEQLASILSDAGDGDRLAPVVARLQSLAPATSTTKYYAASLAFIRQRPDLAVRDAEASVQADPSNAKARNLLGAALASLGQRDRAREAFLASLAADPREPATYTNLATLELESGNRVRAKQYFAEALTVDPTNTVARDGLLGLIGSR
jgi:tetratricopeptide (TPR) repeat protein